MLKFKLPALQSLFSSRWLSVLVLVFALQAALLLWLTERKHAETLQALSFKQSVVTGAEAIETRIEEYRQILKGVEQLYLSSQFVSAEELRLYVEDYTRNALYSSLNAIGFIKYINLQLPETQSGLDQPLPRLLKQLQIKPGVSEVAPLLYIEPRNDVNREPLFKDTFTDARMRADLLQAGEQGGLVMSGHYLAGAVVQRYKTYVMQAPVYRPGTEAGRVGRAYLNGWVFLRFDIRTLVLEALNGLEQQQIQFDLFDLDPEQGDTRLYHTSATYDGQQQSQPPDYRVTQILNIHGQNWRLTARSTPAYEDAVNYHDADAIGIIGLVVSLLLAGLVDVLYQRKHTRQTLQQYDMALSSSEQRWQVAMASTGDGFWDWNVPLDQVQYSAHWKKILGYGPDELDPLPATWHQRIHPDDAELALRVHQQVLAGEREQYAIEYRMLCKDGAWKWVFDRGMVFMRDAGGNPQRILGTLADISKIKQSDEMVWQFANVDTLTGLPNRRLFLERLEAQLQSIKQSAHKLAVVFLDIDRFKEINDAKGHDQGDKLLLQAGKRLQGCVAHKDLVARLGGDEFIILLSEANANYVEALALRVLEALSQPFQLDDTHGYVSASLGIAIYPDDATNKEDLMKRVDQAMYASKQRGGNCFTYFTPRMQQHAEQRMRLAHDLRQALEQQEFFLEYQPVVDLQSRVVAKAEALIRWQHPRSGLIPPMEFIGIAEDNQLIVPIGEWVFKTAIAQCVQWRQNLHPDFQVAVNKSPVQFAPEHRKPQDWLSALSEQGQPGNMVVVEITERLLMDDNPLVSERFAQYQTLGIQVALDDFGTGYSALSYLKKFHIDYVKIDRSFVRELGSSTEDEALCRTIIMMAHSLGMRVIAEGIENQTQLTMLQQMGCDFGQGYFFSPPLRSEAFADWVTHWQQQTAVLNA